MRLIDADLMEESITRATGLAKIIIGKEKEAEFVEKMILNLISAQPTVKLKEKQKDNDNGWIPVVWHKATKNDDVDTEENLFFAYCLLPDDYQKILVCDRYGDMYLDVFCRDGNKMYLGKSGVHWIGNIVAWQPLPAPYEKDNSKIGGEKNDC